jgi:cobalt-precorrin 5A hydrolase
MHNIDPQSVAAVGTIRIKKDEAGLRSLCEEKGWPLFVYDPRELQEAPGQFTPSDFVRSVTGVDNVCERAAFLASGRGRGVFKKFAQGGVTIAAAEGNFSLWFAEGEV